MQGSDYPVPNPGSN